MTTIGPSQGFKDLVNEYKKATAGEGKNIINQDEAKSIKEQLMKEVGGLKSEADVKKYMEAASAYLSGEGFKDTNVSFKSTIVDKVAHATEPTEFSFEISGKTTQTIPGTKEPDVVKMNFGVTDFKPKATNDAKEGTDNQFKVLSADSNNFLKFDQNTGKITGYHNATVGQESTLPQGMPTNIKDVIKADFLRYASAGGELTKVYPMNAEGKFDKKVVDDFMNSLKSIPGNATNNNITEQGVKELLSFIHKGTNTAGVSDVKQLQGLLKNMTGETGAKISDYNNPPGGDGKYGFATTLQVRSLGASLSVTPGKETPATTIENPVETSGQGSFLDADVTKLIPPGKQVMIALDVSGSMKGNAVGTLSEYNKTVKENPTSNIGVMVFDSNSQGSFGEVVFAPGEKGKFPKLEKEVDGLKTKFDAAKEKMDNAKTTLDDSKVKRDDLQKKYNDLLLDYNKLTGTEKKEFFNTKMTPVKAELEAARTQYTNNYTAYQESKTEFSEAKSDYTSAKGELKGKYDEVVTDLISKSNGTRSESGSRAAVGSLAQMDPKGKEPFVIVQTDEPDKSPETMKQLINDAMSSPPKVDAKSVVFYNPDTKEKVSLADLVDKVSTNGQFDEAKFSSRLRTQEGLAFCICDSDLDKFPAPAKK